MSKAMLIARKVLSPIRNSFQQIIDNCITLRHLGCDSFYEYMTDDRFYIDENFLQRNTLKILIYARNFPAFGGGEKHMAYFCKYFENKHPTAEINILVDNSRTRKVFAYNYPNLDRLKEQFNIELKRTKLIKRHFIDQDFITRLSYHYDIFINSTIRSRFYGLAKKNYYNCMFPPTPEAHFNLTDSVIKKTYSCFITNSHFTDQWLHKYWGDDIKSLCIYPPVLSSEDLDGRVGKMKKRNIVITVGRFFYGAHSKRQDAMIDFWLKNEQNFTDWEFHLVGNRQENAVDKKFIKQILKKAKKSSRIFIHFDLKFPELERLYREAKIYWHAAGFGLSESEDPAKMEHFGITTVEAMSYGVVPVVIDKGGQTEIVDDGVNGYRWNDEERWLEATKDLMRNDDKREEMAISAQAKVLNYTVEAFYAKCDSLFYTGD